MKKRKTVKMRARKALPPNQLFTRNKKLAYTIANKYWDAYSHKFRILAKDKIDVEQEALIALNKASTFYNPSSGRFSTYAGTIISHQLNDIVAGADAQKRRGKVVSLSSIEGKEKTFLLEDKRPQRISPETRTKILQIVQNHPRVHANAKRRFIKHYGLSGKEPMTMIDTAREERANPHTISVQMQRVRKMLAENSELRMLFERMREK